MSLIEFKNGEVIADEQYNKYSNMLDHLEAFRVSVKPPADPQFKEIYDNLRSVEMDSFVLACKRFLSEERAILAAEAAQKAQTAEVVSMGVNQPATFIVESPDVPSAEGAAPAPGPVTAALVNKNKIPGKHARNASTVFNERARQQVLNLANDIPDAPAAGEGLARSTQGSERRRAVLN